MSQQISISVGDVKCYQEYSTTLESNYPTNCGYGSIMEIIDADTEKIIEYKIYGINGKWNSLT